MEKLIELLFDPAVMAYIGGAAFAIWQWFIKKQEITDERKNKAIDFLAAGVESVWSTWLRSLKKSKEDGKLTEAERNKARREAKEVAIHYAKNEGWDLLKYMSKEMIPVVIRNIVDSRKKGGNA